MKKFLCYLRQRAWLIVMPLFVMMAYGNPIHAATEASFSATTSGQTNNLSVIANVNIADADIGKAGNYYMRLEFQQAPYFHNGIGWILFEGGDLPVYITAPLTNLSIEVLHHRDMSGLVGAQLYVGYGLSEEDMISKHKYAMVYTIIPNAAVSPVSNFSATASGSLDNLTLSARLNIADADLGKSGNLYIASCLADQTCYFLDCLGWVIFEGGEFPSCHTTSLASQDFDLLRNIDMSHLLGAQLYLGYGLNQDDMLSNGKYAMVYTVTEMSPTENFSVVASGALDNLSLTARLNIAAADVGKTGKLYAAFCFGQACYFHDCLGWVAFDSDVGVLPTCSTVSLASQDFEVLRNADVSGLLSAQLYVGYGLNQDDMISNHKYGMVYTVADPPLSTDITVSPMLADGATGVSINAPIALAFNVDMDPVSFTPATVTVMQGTTPVPGTLSYAGANLVFTPTITFANNTVYTATIKGGINGVKDLAGNLLANDFVWHWTTAAVLAPADTIAPTVTSTIADGATNVSIATTVAVRFSELMNPASITPATVMVMQGYTPVPGVLRYSGTSLVFTPSNPLANNTYYIAMIKGGANGVKDLAGNPLADDFIWRWTTATAVALADTTPPTVTSAIADGATNVSVATTVTATFSEVMSSASINPTTVTMMQGTTPMPGTLRYSGINLVFTPLGMLENNTVYTAVIKGGVNGVKDLVGNPLASDLVWRWTTATAVVPADTTAPTVTSAIANGSTGVPIDSLVVATFSEAMNPASISSATVIVLQGSTPMAGSLSYAGTNLVFTPSSPLANNTNYTAVIKGGVDGVKDLAGNPLASNFTWRWTTIALVAPADTTAPSVTSAIANGATGVSINTTVAASFSEAMNPVTINTATVTVMQGTTPVMGSLSYAGTNLVFTPLSPLANNTDYTATIKSGVDGVKDLAGNPLASDFIWRWTTIALVAPADTTAPTVTSAIVDGEFYVDVDTTINATFSEPMSSDTINSTNFTLLQGTTPVPGTLRYADMELVFTPSSPLAYNMPYTATIKGGVNGVKDLVGNALVNDLVWDWITHTKPLSLVQLGTAGNFAVLSKTGISSISPSVVTGDMGVSPAALTYITGFSLIADATNVFATSTQVVGNVYAANNAVPTPSNLTTAISDMALAYTDAAGRPIPDFLNLGGGSIGGLTLAPGLYKWSSGVNIATDVVISGKPNDVWIFQISGDLNMSAAKQIILTDGALAKNIFWQVTGQAVIGTTAHFEGIVLSQTEVILATGASMNGRALAQTAVTLDSATLTQPAL
jgi:hypothetical protein